ncbi:MAG: hypothetical protein KDE27_28935, partial [Planctomycetes bacterium]|nr:hypothetical protein [Planctomycetota bacterium]
LAEAELAVRQDARSFDALAFARLRSGDVAGAEDAMQHALAVGLREARLELHAALIADAAGADVGSHLAAARAGQAALWPSERRALDRLAASR